MNKRKIYVFGRGSYFRAKQQTFLDNFSIYAFIDNSVADEISDLGIMAYNPEKLKELPPYDIFCVSANWFDMWKQLISLGIADERIKFGLSVCPFQDGVEKIISEDNGNVISEEGRLYYISEQAGKQVINGDDDIKKILRNIVSDSSNISALKMLSDSPVSRLFGSERGKAVDRYYIEKFLDDNKTLIRGTVLEVLNNKYTLQFGEDRVMESVVSHVKGWGNGAILCNFETGEGVEFERYDCIICTQTLQYIYDLKAAIINIHKMLKDGGTALITVPGIKPLCEYDNKNWGEYWSFTSNSLRRICSEIFAENKIEIMQYGNVKTATAYLYGVCTEELTDADFENDDPQYPFLICVKVSR